MRGFHLAISAGSDTGHYESPVEKLDTLSAPVLVAHGVRNPRFRKEQPDRLTQKLCSLEKKVETVFIENEGHRFVQEKNVRRYYDALDAFLGEVLTK